MKEEVCYTLKNPSKNECKYDLGWGSVGGVGDDTTATKAQYQLPDGQVINLMHERHRSAEVLFQPFLCRSEERPIQEVLLTSILQSDMDLRLTLF